MRISVKIGPSGILPAGNRSALILVWRGRGIYKKLILHSVDFMGETCCTSEYDSGFGNPKQEIKNLKKKNIVKK